MNANAAALPNFRDDFYACCFRRADALFMAGPLSSPVHLSGEPTHRRGAASTRRSCHSLADGQRVYAVDCSAWARCDAEVSPERGFYYHPSRHSVGLPPPAARAPGVGWSYQWLA